MKTSRDKTIHDVAEHRNTDWFDIHNQQCIPAFNSRIEKERIMTNNEINMIDTVIALNDGVPERNGNSMLFAWNGITGEMSIHADSWNACISIHW